MHDRLHLLPSLNLIIILITSYNIKDRNQGSFHIKWGSQLTQKNLGKKKNHQVVPDMYNNNQQSQKKERLLSLRTNSFWRRVAGNLAGSHPLECRKYWFSGQDWPHFLLRVVQVEILPSPPLWFPLILFSLPENLRNNIWHEIWPTCLVFIQPN